jgi:predicted kinase
MVTVAPGPVTPGYTAAIPASILTPDRVETRIGTLEFRDGVPTSETSQLVYDHLDFCGGSRPS